MANNVCIFMVSDVTDDITIHTMITAAHAISFCQKCEKQKRFLFASRNSKRISKCMYPSENGYANNIHS